MSHRVPTGELIGSCVDHAIWFAVGAYLAWLRPRQTHREVRLGKISEEEARQKLKKFSPFLGYAIRVVAGLWTLSDFT